MFKIEISNLISFQLLHMLNYNQSNFKNLPVELTTIREVSINLLI